MELWRRWPHWILLAALSASVGSGFVHGRWSRARLAAGGTSTAAEERGSGAVPALADIGSRRAGDTSRLPSRGGSASTGAPEAAVASQQLATTGQAAPAPVAAHAGAQAPATVSSSASGQTTPAKSPPAATGGGPSGEYVVKSGDTLGEIALRHGVDLDALLAVNGLTGPDIFPAQVLRLPTGANVREHTVVSGDTTWDLALKYRVSVAQLAAANSGVNLELLQIGQVIRLPAGASASGATQPDQVLTGEVFQWPVHGPITSVFGPRWGRFHHGVDIAANTGVPIRAARDGIVVTSGWVDGYGNTVILRHGSELRTLYAHASQLLVRVGESVQAGQVIARVGSTGNSTGPHLHFELIAGRPVDPLAYLPVPGS